MKRSASVVLRCIAVLAFVVITAGVGRAQSITWIPSTTFTDNSVMTSQEKAAMKFYLRARKVGDASPRKYFAETVNGANTWTGDLSNAFVTWGLGTPVPGEEWEITVSQAFTNPSGVELDSIQSTATTYRFPFGPDRTPSVPLVGPVITDQ